MNMTRDCHTYMDILNRYQNANESQEMSWIDMQWQFSNSFGKESVNRHIQENISKFSSMFLMTLFTFIEFEIAGKKIEPWR